MSATTTPRHRMARVAAPACGASQRPYSRLGQYSDRKTGALREIVSAAIPDDSVLVIDRFAGTHIDSRLVARLQPDEPSENARIVCELYLADETKGRCRRMTAEDLTPSRRVTTPPDGTCGMSSREPLRDCDGYAYRIRRVPTEDGLTPELRWTRSTNPGNQFEVVRLREIIAHLEAYEPARTITADMLVAHRESDRVSTHRLRQELKNLNSARVVLNRGLREAVQRKIAQGDLSMSEIAMRCGRTRNDRNGNIAGETTWLARRIGQVPEGGKDQPTPWVHTDVLALIARDGLGGSPREVEL
jgi:hypothetical protein